MSNDLNTLLQMDAQAHQYFISLPKYAQEAVRLHTNEISNADALKLFAETFMQDDSYRGS